MKHGNKIFCYPRRLFFLMALVLVGSAFNSCKSSRNMVEETRTEFHYDGQDSTRVDSVLMGGNERSSESDTANISTDVRGSSRLSAIQSGDLYLYIGRLRAIFRPSRKEIRRRKIGFTASMQRDTPRVPARWIPSTRKRKKLRRKLTPQYL